jgi:hypothetical protein
MYHRFLAWRNIVLGMHSNRKVLAVVRRRRMRRRTWEVDMAKKQGSKSGGKDMGGKGHMMPGMPMKGEKGSGKKGKGC